MNIRKTILPSGSVSYLLRYRDPSGKQIARRFPKLEQAREVAAQLTTDLQTGSYTDRSLGKVKLREFAAGVLETSGYEPSTYALNESCLRLYIAPKLGDRKLNSFSATDVRRWISDLQADKVGASTIVHAHQFLRKVFTVAVNEDRIPRNPASKVTPPKPPEREGFFLTETEVAKLASEAGDHGTLVRFLAFTGLRIGEAAGLRVRNLDLLSMAVKVEEQASEVGGKIIQKRPKTPRSIRTVPVPASMRPELDAMIKGKGPADFVFTGKDGGQLRQSNFRNRVLSKAAGRAEITRGKDTPRPHDLRHTFASLCAKAGFSLFEVSRMMGHASIRITADRYMHLFPERRHEAHDRMDAMTAPPEPTNVREIREAK